MSVAKMTPADLSKFLTAQPSHRLRDPQVIVDLIRSSEKTIYDRGEGWKTKRSLIPEGYHLCRQFSPPEDSGTLPAQGQDNDIVSRKMNLEEVVMDAAKEQLGLAPHDVIFVPRTAIANATI